MAKEFKYSMTRMLGTVDNDTVEIGHYTVDGQVMPDKVYRVSRFTRKNGAEGSRASVVCTLSQAAELGRLLLSVCDDRSH